MDIIQNILIILVSIPSVLGLLLFICEIIDPTKIEVEQFEGKDRFTFIGECGYHFSDNKYYDNKLKIYIIK